MEQNIELSNEKYQEKDIIGFQPQCYDLDNLKERLVNFEDSSIPSRLLTVQRGLLKSSGLSDNINRLQRKLQYLIESEKFEAEIKKKKLGQLSEILLFAIAFIEIAPIVAEYGAKLFPYAGIVFNCLIALSGSLLLFWKNR